MNNHGVRFGLLVCALAASAGFPARADEDGQELRDKSGSGVRTPTWSLGAGLFAPALNNDWNPYGQLTIERKLSERSSLAWTSELGGSISRYESHSGAQSFALGQLGTGIRWFLADDTVVRPSVHALATLNTVWEADHDADVSVGGKAGIAADSNLSDGVILRLGMDVLQVRHVVDGGLWGQTGDTAYNLGVGPRVGLHIGW